jgi:homoserine dehydrogenase
MTDGAEERSRSAEEGCLIVLKFGGTSLGTAERIRRAAQRIRHHRRSGRPVLVVVSAAGQSTDRIAQRLAAVARRRGGVRTPASGGPSAREQDRALATGEELSAALLSAALWSAGVPARSLRGGEAGLRASGAHGAAVLGRLRPAALRGLLGRGVVPVVAGFQAEGPGGETVTLGRGASDLTAVFLADALGASECHLVTDVDGVFEADPRIETGARRFDRLTHAALVRLAVGGARVVQPAAAALAARSGVPLRIYDYRTRPDATTGTVVVPHTSPPRVGAEPRRVRVALAGCGTVAGELARAILTRRDALAAAHGVRLEIVRVLVRRASLPRRAVPASLLTDSVDVFLESAADVTVEALGGVDPAARIARAVLGRGSRFVTANKTLVAALGEELAALAAVHGGSFDFEAAVGGGIPVVRTLRDALGHASVRRIQGVLNGTSNYVLSAMEQGRTLKEALSEAQRMGYAEADPTRDLDGTDAAEKLAILAWLAFGVAPRAVEVRRRGILDDADDLVRTAIAGGGRLRLLAECTRSPGGIVAGVAPAVVPAASPFGLTVGAENRISIDLGWEGEIALTGPGAGAEPTSTALLADVLRAAAPLRSAVSGIAGPAGAYPSGSAATLAGSVAP